MLNQRRNGNRSTRNSRSITVIRMASVWMLLFSLLTVSPVQAQNPAVDFRRGDVNADDGIDLSDAVSLLSYLYSGGVTPSCLDAADVDDSDQLDLGDPITLLSYMYIGGPPPPDPGLTCGIDPTPGTLDCASFDPCPVPPDPACNTPQLNSVSPPWGAAGDVLTIDGVNFSDQRIDNRVIFRSTDGEIALDGLVTAVSVEVDPCDDPSELEVVVPGGVRSGFVELLVDGVSAGEYPFSAAPEIVGFAVWNDGIGFPMVNASGAYFPDTLVMYGYNLEEVDVAYIDDGFQVLESPSISAGPGTVNYLLPPQMEALKVELPVGIFPSASTTPLWIQLDRQFGVLYSSKIQVPLATLLAPGLASGVPPYVTAGLMPGGIRSGEIPLQFTILTEPARGRFDAIPEYEDPISGAWLPCSAVQDSFDGLGFLAEGLFFIDQAPFALNAGKKMTYLWDSSLDLPDGIHTTRIRLQLTDPVPSSAIYNDPGVWISGAMVVHNSSVTSAAGEITETFDDVQYHDQTSAGTAVWGGGVLQFNSTVSEPNSIAMVGDGTADVVLESTRSYQIDSDSGTITDITDPQLPVVVLAATSGAPEIWVRSFVMEFTAAVIGVGEAPLVIRCSGTGNPDDIVLRLEGTLDLSGSGGFQGDATAGGGGGIAGPGGGRGGTGATMEVNAATQIIDALTHATAGLSGGGAGESVTVVVPASIYSTRAGSAGGGGGANRGEDGINTFSFNLSNRGAVGSGGIPTQDALGIRLRGGGGGGGGGAGTRRPISISGPVVNNGGGGGGGGGALGIVADGSVWIRGELLLGGGEGERGVQGTTAGAGGGGGGGSLIVRASGNIDIDLPASIDASGGVGGIQLYSPTGSQVQMGGAGADGLILLEALGVVIVDGSVFPAPLIGDHQTAGTDLSSAVSHPYSTTSADGSIHGHLQLQPALLELVSGTPEQLHILYEGFAVSDVSAGGRGPSLGIVSDPALLVEPQSVVMRYYLFENPAVPAATPWIDSVTVPFDEAP